MATQIASSAQRTMSEVSKRQAKALETAVASLTQAIADGLRTASTASKAAVENVAADLERKRRVDADALRQIRASLARVENIIPADSTAEVDELRADLTTLSDTVRDLRQAIERSPAPQRPSVDEATIRRIIQECDTTARTRLDEAMSSFRNEMREAGTRRDDRFTTIDQLLARVTDSNERIAARLASLESLATRRVDPVPDVHTPAPKPAAKAAAQQASSRRKSKTTTARATVVEDSDSTSSSDDDTSSEDEVNDVDVEMDGDSDGGTDGLVFEVV